MGFDYITYMEHDICHPRKSVQLARLLAHPPTHSLTHSFELLESGFVCFQFSNLLPDFVLTGAQYQAQGPGGYECAGFWGNAWDFRPELASCAYCAAVHWYNRKGHFQTSSYHYHFLKNAHRKHSIAHPCYTPAPLKVDWGYTGFTPMSVHPSVPPSVCRQGFQNFFEKTIRSIYFIPGIYPYGASLLTPILFRAPSLIFGPLVAKYLAENRVSGTFWNNYWLNSFFCCWRIPIRVAHDCKIYWIFLDEVGSDQSGGILSPFMGTACWWGMECPLWIHNEIYIVHMSLRYMYYCV